MVIEAASTTLTGTEKDVDLAVRMVVGRFEEYLEGDPRPTDS